MLLYQIKVIYYPPELQGCHKVGARNCGAAKLQLHARHQV